jgi:hypothetical protein
MIVPDRRKERQREDREAARREERLAWLKRHQLSI